jgi:predicted nicotinamide N-methyase
VEELISDSSYDVKNERILIGDFSYSIESLLDRQQFSDPKNEALDLGISSASWPIFGQIWPMSRILAKIMAKEPLEERSILEVGCGIALPSLVIKKLGGTITASDYHPLANTFLKRNVILNSLGDIPYLIGNWNTIETNQQKFDLIIASDVLYETQHVELLSEHIRRNSNKRTEVILVDQGRGFHRAFARAMQRIGFEHTWTDLSDYYLPKQRKKGFIFRFSQARESGVS